MEQPRNANGTFAGMLTVTQFEEFRKGLERRFDDLAKGIVEGRRSMDQRFNAQEKALESARIALKELTATHSEAHKAEHDAGQKALGLESGRVDGRLMQVEGRLVERVAANERAILISATKDEIASVGKTAKNATIGSVIAGVVSVIAGVAAIVNAMGGAGP